MGSSLAFPGWALAAAEVCVFSGLSLAPLGSSTWNELDGPKKEGRKERALEGVGIHRVWT